MVVIGAQVTGGDRGSGYWWWGLRLLVGAQVIGAQVTGGGDTQVTGGDRGSGYWW